MDAEFLCKHLKKLTSVLNGIPIEKCFARKKKNELYVFGHGDELNYVTKQMAIFIVLFGKEEHNIQADVTQDKINRPPSTTAPKKRVRRRRRY